MAHRGRPRKDIAKDLGIHRIGVTRWLNAYCQHGLQGLLPKKAKGKAAKIPDSMASEIRRRVIDGPAACGLGRANWTHEELADHLFKTRGIKASRSAMRRFCRKIDARPYRPTYRYLRGDPAKQGKAKEDPGGLKKSPGGRARPGGCSGRSPGTCSTSGGCTRGRSSAGWC
jgi:transposase